MNETLEPSAIGSIYGARFENFHVSHFAQRRLRRRYRQERLFRICGLAAITAAFAMLSVLIGTIAVRAMPAFQSTDMRLEIYLDPQEFTDQDLTDVNYQALLNQSLYDLFPAVEARRDRSDLRAILSRGAARDLQDMVVNNPGLVGQTIEITVPVSDDFDLLSKGKIDRDLPERRRSVNDNQLVWFDELVAQDRVVTGFNWHLFTNTDSREPELAGLSGALVGSLMTLTITLLLSFPVAVAAAIYLEEFAPKNRWTDLIEININNLAAVPSIIFGLLGMALFLNIFGMTRSAPLVGGCVLALMTLPTIMIATRAALKAVPPSIREAALGIGASRLQVVFHHVLPLAMPGIMTGTIIGMAQALGETAPLLLIGMNAFILDIPANPLHDAATVLPVQIYRWWSLPEPGYDARAAAGILVLLVFLIMMNGLAIWLRHKFERRW